MFNKALIKSIVLSKGWEDVEKLLKSEFNKIKIDKTKNVGEIGKQYLAKEMAFESLENVLSIMHRIANEEIKKEIKYK